LIIVGVVAVTLAVGVPVSAEASGLSLPAPTGPYRVGTTSLHLVDVGRVDPLAPAVRDRELMVRLWYPAARVGGSARAGYLPPGVAAALTLAVNAQLGTAYPADLLTFPTHSHEDAPVAGGRHPVLIFSPGLGLNAALYTGVFEELASRGYVVAGVDHTYDAPAVEFPGGRVEVANPEALTDTDRLRAVRAADVRFVLDRLTARGMDVSRVAVFGHSLGSRTAIDAMESDRRFDAGAALDGNPLGSASPDRPFLLLGNQKHRRVDDPDWAAFYDRLRGPRLHLVVDGALHNDLSDITVFKARIPNLDALFEIGSIDGNRMLTIERRYVTAWFDQVLRDCPNPLLRGESSRFPEVDFQP
jgi:dienelactone hydrolase